MSIKSKTSDPSDSFLPKLIEAWREGFTLPQMRGDILAGITVAIVALPLSMAIAIASGLTPAQGLYTAVVGGFIVSALGGSRVQIGGPAAAFIVLVASTLQQFGLGGLLLATMLSGLFLLAMGRLRLGSYIKFIPMPVTVGFMMGIAAVIFISQIKALLGLELAVAEPGPLLQKIPVLWQALPSISLPTTALSIGTIGGILLLRRYAPRIPALLLAVLLGAVVNGIFHLKVATLGSAFGDMPRFLPAPSWPDFPLDRIGELLRPALAFALLGAVESLLCATVADGMSGRRHSSNGELVAQGFANMLTPIFGGFCVTGTIARTATNVRAGAQTPVSGIVHAIIILLIMLVAAQFAEYIPIASLSGVLAVAAWGMIDRHAALSLFRAAPREALVVVVTLALTLFRDLTDAMIGGFALCALFFIHRMAEVTAHPLLAKMNEAGASAAAHHHAGDSTVPEKQNRHIVTYHMPPGAFFFGTSALLGTVLEQIADRAENIIVDLSETPYIDATGAQSLLGLAQRTQKRGGAVTLIGLSPEARSMLEYSGLKPPLVSYGGSEQVS